jgi:prolipoprotein diacylglyceryltransferase
VVLTYRLIRYSGVGEARDVAVDLPIRPVPAVSLCYMLSMALGAKVLSNIRQGTFHGGDLAQPERFSQGGMWGGALLYLVLAVPLVSLLTRKSLLELRPLPHKHRSGRERQPVAERRYRDADLSPDQRGHLARLEVNTEERWMALDLVALAAPIPMAIAKLGCLCGGCCYGKPCDLPWSITFPAGNPIVLGGVPLHPTQLYDVFALVAVAIVLAWASRPRWRGTLLLWFVASYCVGRLLTEFWRAHPAGQVHWGSLTPFQWLCATTAAACAAALVLYSRRMRSPYSKSCAQETGRQDERCTRSSKRSGEQVRTSRRSDSASPDR